MAAATTQLPARYWLINGHPDDVITTTTTTTATLRSGTNHIFLRTLQLYLCSEHELTLIPLHYRHDSLNEEKIRRIRAALDRFFRGYSLVVPPRAEGGEGLDAGAGVSHAMPPSPERRRAVVLCQE